MDIAVHGTKRVRGSSVGVTPQRPVRRFEPVHSSCFCHSAGGVDSSDTPASKVRRCMYLIIRALVY